MSVLTKILVIIDNEMEGLVQSDLRLETVDDFLYSEKIEKYKEKLLKIKKMVLEAINE